MQCHEINMFLFYYWELCSISSKYYNLVTKGCNLFWPNNNNNTNNVNKIKKRRGVLYVAYLLSPHLSLDLPNPHVLPSSP